MDDRDPKSDVELYLLRHADAGDPEEFRGDDAQRPLSNKGRRQASTMGRFLNQRGFKPDAILSSPKIRARQTAELVAAALDTKVQLDARLVGMHDLARLAEIVDGAGRKLLLVGHDPEFSELAADLTGAAHLPLKKGGLARIDASLPLSAGGGTLRWLLTPDLAG